LGELAVVLVVEVGLPEVVLVEEVDVAPLRRISPATRSRTGITTTRTLAVIALVKCQMALG